MHYLDRRRDFVPLILGFFAVWPAFTVAAPVQYEAVRVGQGQFTAAGVGAPITVRTTATGVAQRYTQIVPVANKTALGNIARTAIRGGWQTLALSSLIESAGYVIDSATQQVKNVQTTTSYVANPSWQYQAASNVCVSGTGSSPSQCDDFQALASSCTFVKYNPYNATSGSCSIAAWKCENPPFTEGYPDYIVNRCYPPGVVTSTDSTQVIDLSPEEWDVLDDSIFNLPNSDRYQLVTKALGRVSLGGYVDSANYPATITSTNTDTQQLLDDWPELRTKLGEVVNSELARLKTAEDPNFVPTQGETDLMDQATSSLPPEVEGGAILDFPPFCEWASWLCAPFVESDHPDLPQLDLDVPSYDSSLPSDATCPAPLEITIGPGTFNLSFEPACAMAEAIRVPLIAISYLLSAFIVAGVRR